MSTDAVYFHANKAKTPESPLQRIVDQILQEFQEAMFADYRRLDVEKCHAYYHKNAVLVHVGHNVHYGEEIHKAYQDLVKIAAEMRIFVEENKFTDDLKVLYQRGKFEVSPDSPKWHYQQVFLRQPDGSYRIYHDEYEYDPNWQQPKSGKAN